MAQRVICSARVCAHALAGTQSYKDSKKIGKCKGEGKIGGGEVMGRIGNASLDGGASLDRVNKVDKAMIPSPYLPYPPYSPYSPYSPYLPYSPYPPPKTDNHNPPL